MKKQEPQLNKKRKRGAGTEKTQKNIENNNSKDIFLEQTYSFIDRIKKKISEIKDIRSNHIEGILTNDADELINKKPKNYLEYNSENCKDSDCFIIHEELYDSKNNNYKNDMCKIDNFDPTKDCIICFKKLNKILQFICGHRVCNKCGTKWIKIKKECPICREDI